MAGIYIHIPFCKQACFYCNFHFSTSLRQKEEMLDCLCREISMHTHTSDPEHNGMVLTEKTPVETIYFGGGTPSLLSAAEIDRLLDVIRENFTVASDAEVTLEANPDDVTLEKMRELRKSGINRLSLGIQSFDDGNLKWMNRAHNAEQAMNSIRWIKEAGFKNFSADLIFGIPRLTNEKWIDNIDRLMNFGVPHLACYALTVEPKTALAKMIKQGKKENVNEEDQARQFEILMAKMYEAGYEHYETSNFALPGFRSKHNSSYWQHKIYLGIGPSAHSFDGERRYWNMANNPLYIKAIQNGTSFFEKETLTPKQQFDEYIMTSIRTVEGIDLNYIASHFGVEHKEKIFERLKNVRPDWFSLGDKYVSLTDKGKLFTDKVSVDLFD